MRVRHEAPPTKRDVLDNLAKSLIRHDEVFVQVGATLVHPDSATTLSDGETIGMLHLGPGRCGNLAALIPHLAKGAIVIVEDCTPGSEAYDCVLQFAARGFLSSPSEARHFPGLAVCTYYGKAQ